MKQQYFSISDGLGGAEQLLSLLVKDDLANSQVCFFGVKTTEYWIEEGINSYYCNNSVLKFVKYCLKNKFDFVFSTHLMINAFLGFLRFLGVLKTHKLICRESTSVFGRYQGLKLFIYKIAYWVGYRKIDLLITQSDLMKDTLIHNVPYLSKRINIKTIPNLFVNPLDQLVNQDIEIFEKSIVAAGRLIPEKGFDILIEAFFSIVEKHPKMNLVILGEGNERGKLENLIKTLKLSKNVHLLGFVKNVYPYFKNAEVCVVSSRKEGFPNVLLQMMSQNKRVVSTLCAGGINEIQGVVTCKADDKNSLLKSIEKCLEKKVLDERLWFDEELGKRSVVSFKEQMLNSC